MGWHRAGFDVTGVDIKDMAGIYPFKFIQGDAIEYIHDCGREFDFIAAGPPCQGQIAITAGNRGRPGWTDDHVNLIPATRAALEAVGVLYSIENGPSKHLRPDVVLCGLKFGLPTLRHRYFELGGWTAPQPEHVGPRNHRGQLTAGWRHGCLRTFEPSACPLHGAWCRATVYGVYGNGGGKPTVAEAQHALGIDWVHDIDALNESVPPAYAEYLGGHLMKHFGWAGAAATVQQPLFDLCDVAA
jgi:DNA (cytosine-5)-methyltransferase 1